jgi:hypothetical protein
MPRCGEGGNGTLQEDEDTLDASSSAAASTRPIRKPPPLFLSYKDYCGSKTISEKAFSKNMEERGYTKKPTKTGIIWAGLELLPGRIPSHGPKGEG